MAVNLSSMDMDGKTVAITGIIGLVLFLVTIFVVFGFGPKRKTKGQLTILIAGPSGSGKTSLYLTWQDSEDKKETVTSITPNESTSFNLAPSYRVVDSPGNDKLFQYTQSTLTESNVKAVLYVIDASCGPEGIKESARALVPILEYTETKLIPVMIAANKFDLFSALSVPKIKSLLEQEISEIRDTKSRSVPGSNEDSAWGDEEREFLGVDGKSFEFNDLEGEVDIIDGSVKAGRVHKWEEWLHETLSL